MPEKLSLCICTFNRCESLERTLDSLTRQIGRGAFELLIVDNNCTDKTADVVCKYASQLPVRRVVEPKQGLSHSRNRALAEFSGDILLFTDDDVILDPGWLAAYAKALGAYPEADIFGGRCLADFNSARPRWLVDCNLALLSGVIVNFDLGSDLRVLDAGEPDPIGASFAIRRRLIKDVGEFRVDLGRVGLAPGRGEETDFIQRAVSKGAKRVYVGDALAWHRVQASRLTLRALYRHGLEKGRAQAIMEKNPQKVSLIEPFLFLLRGVGQMAKGRGDRARQCVIHAGRVTSLRRSLRRKSLGQ